MNKLISRNPILRFKLGRKIVKAENSWGKDFGTKYIPPVNITKVPKGWFYSIDLGTANSWNMDTDIVNHDFSPYVPNLILNYPHSGLVADAYEDLYDTLLRALQIATHNIKKASEPFHRRSYDNSVMDPERSYKAENKRYIANVELPKQETQTNNAGLQKQNTQTKKNSQKQNKKSGTSSFANAFNKALLGGYMFGKMGGWNRSMGNTISDQESLNYLKEMGLDGLNALQIQQYINQLLGNNSVKEDNKWGNLSRAGLKALYENWKLQQKPQTQSPIGNPVIESLRSLEEIPQLSQDLLMFNNINSKTFNAPLPPRTIPYNRSMTRDIIKDITGNSAYNFTGDLRKALRQYLNGEQYDQEAIKAFGDLNQYNKYMKWRLKKGGILPSRNAVTRFKNRKFN